MKPLYIYLAGQYTTGDPAMNVRYAIDCAEQVAAQGDYPFIPHLSHLWHLIHPHQYEFWMLQDLAWLDRCDAIIRMTDQFPGGSPGADREVAYAKSKDMRIFIGINEYLQHKKDEEGMRHNWYPAEIRWDL